MSKGSGRRRITPSDGLRYNEDSDMTNIEERGGHHRQSAKREIALGLRTGAKPTVESYYGHTGRRWAGKGRKDDNRSWKSSSKGKQYEKNLEVKENKENHRPVPENVAYRLREKSINADITKGYPCKASSTVGKGQGFSLNSVVDMSEKFLVKFGGESYRGYAAYRAKPHSWSSYRYTSSSYRYSYQKTPYTVDYDLQGWSLFEEMVRKVQYDNLL